MEKKLCRNKLLFCIEINLCKKNKKDKKETLTTTYTTKKEQVTMNIINYRS